MTATATGTYATLTELKRRLGITDSTDDTELQLIADWANAGVESFTHRAITSTTLSGALFDGYDAQENGRMLPIPDGIQSISSLEIATYTGGTFTTVPSTDYFLRPTAQQRDPGWPATELWMTDIPSASNTTPYFPPGFANIRISGSGGWAFEPDEVIDVALNMAVAKWRGRGAGGGDTYTIGGDGERTFTRYLSWEDKGVLRRYQMRPVEII